MSLNKKFFTVLIILLLIANTVTIAVFWLKGRQNAIQFNGGPAQFIIKELNLSTSQQEQYLALVREHQNGSKPIKDEIRTAKENFFDLLKKPNVSNTETQTAAKKVSELTEKLDLFTFNHFASLRAICNEKQKQKFDEIITTVIQRMGSQSNGRNNQPDGPPPPHPRFEDGPASDEPPHGNPPPRM